MTIAAQPLLPIQPDLIERTARNALGNAELPRVQHIQPVNGSYDYFIVHFAGQQIFFKLNWHDENGWYGGEYGVEIAALSGKAVACCNAINDLMLGVAKVAAATALTTLQAQNDEMKRVLRDLGYRAEVEALQAQLDSMADVLTEAKARLENAAGEIQRMRAVAGQEFKPTNGITAAVAKIDAALEQVRSIQGDRS